MARALLGNWRPYPSSTKVNLMLIKCTEETECLCYSWLFEEKLQKLATTM